MIFLALTVLRTLEGLWMLPRIAGRPAAVYAQLPQVVNRAVSMVRMQEIIVHHLGIVLDHIQAGMTEQRMQMQHIQASTQRENDECSAQRVSSHMDACSMGEPPQE